MNQVKPDMEFVNEFLAYQGKKHFLNDPFKKRRLDTAIHAFEILDFIDGICARAKYYTYFNDTESAEALLEVSIKRFGYNEAFASALLQLLYSKADWEQTKRELRKYLTLTNKLHNKTIHRYFMQCSAYLDFSDDFLNLVQKYDIKNFKNWESTISKSKGIVKDIIDRDCTLETYRKIISLARYIIHQEYDLDCMITPKSNDSEIQVIFSSELWSDEEVKELTDKINQAILAVDDIYFQIQTDKISVFCINFDADKLPEDFVYFDDKDDKDKIDKVSQLVQSRMLKSEKFNPTYDKYESVNV